MDYYLTTTLRERLLAAKGNNTVIRMSGDEERILDIVEDWLTDVYHEGSSSDPGWFYIELTEHLR